MLHMLYTDLRRLSDLSFERIDKTSWLVTFY
jgi:hypothetical protein